VPSAPGVQTRLRANLLNHDQTNLDWIPRLKSFSPTNRSTCQLQGQVPVPPAPGLQARFPASLPTSIRPSLSGYFKPEALASTENQYVNRRDKSPPSLCLPPQVSKFDDPPRLKLTSFDKLAATQAAVKQVRLFREDVEATEKPKGETEAEDA
jgi:hypothetical protein